MFDKKAQIGETMTWVAATLIIIMILIISIFFASGSDFFKSKTRGFSSSRISDFVVAESLLGYLQTEQNGEIVYEGIKDEAESTKVIFREPTDFEANLAEKIFLKLYKDDYNPIWFGLIVNSRTNPYDIANHPFGIKEPSAKDVEEKMLLSETFNLNFQGVTENE